VVSEPGKFRQAKTVPIEPHNCVELIGRSCESDDCS
jgi:hypothetical protein